MKSAAKLLCIVFAILLSNPNSFAQPKLWGTLPNAGSTNSGVIYEYDVGTHDYTIIHDYFRYKGEDMRTALLLADNGKLYGIARGGFGSAGSNLFEYDPVTKEYLILFDFYDSETGMGMSAAECGLMQATNGKIYGLTQGGGTFSHGQLFEYDIQTNTLSFKVHFEETSKGKYPLGTLTQASNGKLYGVTNLGGLNALGVLFEYDPEFNTFARLKNFNGTGIGARPLQGVIQGSNGKLYGMTWKGGNSDVGVVYEYNITSNMMQKLHDFDEANTGAKPQGRLIEASNGNLYGMTWEGGTHVAGVIFEYDLTASTFTKKFDFISSYGTGPRGEFVDPGDGYLYAMAGGGGIYSRGTLFRYEPGSSNVSVLVNFSGEEYGQYPHGSVTLGQGGNMWGVTSGGGAPMADGVLFNYDYVNGLFSKEFDFMAAPKGATPQCGLMMASDGYLYGTTFDGGSHFSGTIFRIDPSTHHLETVFNFDDSNTGSTGGNSYSGPIEASNGLFYGTAMGGDYNSGVLYTFNPDNFSYTVLHHFELGPSGLFPKDNLLEADNGKLYGTAARGGVNDDGVLFEYDISTSTFSKILDFDRPTTGGDPSGALVQSANGKIYGLTEKGGSFSNGVVYELDPATSAYQVIINFDGANKGNNPYGTLLEYGDNTYYGTTRSGGTNMEGTIFVFDAENGILTKLMNFSRATTGGFPYPGLALASDNKFYGTARAGGTYDFGVLFSFDPATNDYAALKNFAEYEDQPYFASLIEVESDFGIMEPAENKLQFTLFPNPAKEYFTISSPDIEEEFQLTIYDINGKLILTEHSRGDFKCEVPDLESGIYTVRITSGNRTGHQKLIVN